MSGSGGGYTTFPRSFNNNGSMPNEQTSNNQCKLNIATQVINPKPNLTNQLVMGDVLIVALDSNLVTIQNNQGQIIGTIAPPNIDKLIDCINQGNFYNAIITEINGGYIRVQVSLQS